VFQLNKELFAFIDVRPTHFKLIGKLEFPWGRGELFRRYFLLWFTFFFFLTGLVSLLTLYDRWRSATELRVARAQSLTSLCLHEFQNEKTYPDRPERWDWERAYQRWAADFPCLEGIALEDRADSRILFSAGVAIPDTGMVLEEKEGATARWIETEFGTRIWTVLPAGETNPRFRLWMNLGRPDTFPEFLKERRMLLAAEAGILGFLFFLFYWRLGSPARYLSPMVATLQRALEHADSPLQIPADQLPGEFRPLAKSISLVLESRRVDHQERKRLDQRVGHHLRQKDHYTRMVKTLKWNRENEKSVIERVQHSLMEANREPVIMLDCTRRILAMNEPALRTLSLSGQTGYPLRHSELEEILDVELQSDTPPGDHRICVRDPYLKKTSSWKVHVSKHFHWNDPTALQYILISLNQETTAAEAGAHATEALLRLLAAAWAENWNENAEVAAPLSEGEKKKVDNLIRNLFTVGQARVEVPDLLNCFGLGARGVFAPDAEFGEVSGGLDLWRAFTAWFGWILSEMTGHQIQIDLAGMSPSRLKFEWTSPVPFAFGEWFAEGSEKTSAFRRELLQKSLEKIRGKIAWHPSAPNTFSLEIHLKARLLTPRKPSSMPMKVEA
jgi:PAS domain-containing protein